MSDAIRPVLDYSTLTRRNRDFMLDWVSAIALAVQIIWYFPYVSFVFPSWLDGSAKQPLRDFMFEITGVMPSIAAVGTALLHLWSQRNVVPRHRRLAMVVLVVGSIFVSLAILDWFVDDIVNRSIPHDLW